MEDFKKDLEKIAKSEEIEQAMVEGFVQAGYQMAKQADEQRMKQAKEK
jgi:hypothetical protein